MLALPQQIEPDSEQLFRLESVIEETKKAFYETGSALRTIRDNRLYTAQYSDFDTYCRERWEMSRRKADYLIKAANFQDHLTRNNCSQLPTNEAQVRHLTSLPLDKQFDAWQKVLESASDGKITAELVKKIVAESKQKSSKSSKKKVQQTSNKFAEATQLTQQLNETLTNLEQLLADDLDAETLATLSPLATKLAIEESRILQLRNELVRRILTHSNGCCPACHQELMQEMESCLCGWNQGQFSRFSSLNLPFLSHFLN